MTALDHDTGVYNVEGTLRAWLMAGLLANTPSSVSEVRLNLDMPEQPLNPPEWSVHFRVSRLSESFQGSHVGSNQHGEIRYGTMEVNCWVSRENNPAWRKQLAQMRDAVSKSVQQLRATGSGLKVYDFYANENTPSQIAQLIKLLTITEAAVPADPNPDIQRARFLIDYLWTEKV